LYREEENGLVELRAPIATLFLNGNELVKAELGGAPVTRDPLEEGRLEEGSVEVDYGGNIKVTTPMAVYDGVAGVITSDGPAVFEHKSFKITGKKMNVDIKRRIIRLENEVNSIFYSKQ
jgi:lipopolysaccharide export system protein LptC